jgi:hypothetical protein
VTDSLLLLLLRHYRKIFDHRILKTFLRKLVEVEIVVV